MRIDFVSFCIDFVTKKNPSFCIDLMSLTKINGSGKSTNEKINHHFFAHCSSVNLNRTAIRSFTWLLGFKIASGGEDTDPRMVCCLCIPFCSLLASLIWCFSNWIMVITEDIMPANGCPLDCNL